jgi:hypothetical protein
MRFRRHRRPDLPPSGMAFIDGPRPEVAAAHPDSGYSWCPYCGREMHPNSDEPPCCDAQRREMDRYNGMVARLRAEHEGRTR